MNYPNNTIVQSYNVSAGRVVQLPCFLDQPEPPDGFRAIVFATPIIGNGGPYLNQNGPGFTTDMSYQNAIEFDLSTLINGNAISRIRSIAIQTSFNGSNSGSGNGNPCQSYILLDSGLMVPTMPNGFTNGLDSFVCADFISASPSFAVIAYGDVVVEGLQCTVAVANFKMSASAWLSSGSSVAGG